MDLSTASERLNELIQSKPSKEELSQGLDSIVGSMAERIFSVIESELQSRAESERKKQDRIDQCWRTVAASCVKTIEEAGSLAPGLSHQEIYVRELHNSVKASQNADEFLKGIEGLTAKWGSRIKYPLYGGGRKKELDNLRAEFRKLLPEEKKSAARQAEGVFLKERENSRAKTDERIDQSAIEFRALLLDALKLEKDPDFLIQLRWFLIQLLTKKLFAKMHTKLNPDQGPYRDLIYLTFEKVLNKIYQSFQVFVNDVTRIKRAGEPGPLADLELKPFITKEIQRANAMVAELENALKSLPLNPKVIALIKSRLKAGDMASLTDPKVFVAISTGQRPESSFEQFTYYLKKETELEDQQREEFLTAIKTLIEPFRVMYYSQINFVRYLKGLTIFQSKL